MPRRTRPLGTWSERYAPGIVVEEGETGDPGCDAMITGAAADVLGVTGEGIADATPGGLVGDRDVGVRPGVGGKPGPEVLRRLAGVSIYQLSSTASIDTHCNRPASNTTRCARGQKHIRRCRRAMATGEPHRLEALHCIHRLHPDPSPIIDSTATARAMCLQARTRRSQHQRRRTTRR